jgi:putative FmdB family regulatory protein
MPIYAYRCESCGFGKDVLQKLSDTPLTQCPECGKDSFRKQVTAAGFQLKGSGWYVTDFRGGNNNGAAAGAPKANGESAKTESAPSAESGAKTESKGTASDASASSSTTPAPAKPASSDSA